METEKYIEPIEQLFVDDMSPERITAEIHFAQLQAGMENPRDVLQEPTEHIETPPYQAKVDPNNQTPSKKPIPVRRTGKR